MEDIQKCAENSTLLSNFIILKKKKRAMFTDPGGDTLNKICDCGMSSN